MTGPPQRVSVFALAGPRPGATKEQRRYYVKWRVDGRDRTRSFKTRAQGDRFRAELVLAVREGVCSTRPWECPAPGSRA